MSSISSSWPIPLSVTSIYGSIVVAIATITVSFIILNKLWKTPALAHAPHASPNLSCRASSSLDIREISPLQIADTSTEYVQNASSQFQDKGIQVSEQGHSQFIEQDARDNHNVDMSIPTQTSSTLQLTRDTSNSEEISPIKLVYGSSNFQISEKNASIILNGDGPFTKVQRNLIDSCMVNQQDINIDLKEPVLPESITALPRAQAAFVDHQYKICFKGTRLPLLQEMVDCVTGSSETRLYVLSGISGIGKSTIAYTIASRAANLNLLGAFFKFSQDENDCKNIKKFFTTMAYQLCVYNEAFAKAIGDVLMTERGLAAINRDPRYQLRVLILDPLRRIIQSRSWPILVVIDALDECDEGDRFSVLAGLGQLVQNLPLFKVILTTDPQLHLDRFLGSQVGYKIFHLQDMEDKIVNDDIRLYLSYSLSRQWQWRASVEEIDSLVRASGRFFIFASTVVRYISDRSATTPASQMQKLLHAFAQDHNPLMNLDHLYTVILRDVLPKDCNNDIVSRYQSIIGAIILIQHALPISTLSYLIDMDVEEIHTVLDKLQSVIFLDSDDVPHIYHKSFRNYLKDQAWCKDPYLRIEPRACHIQIAMRCFEIMDKQLKYNILGLGELARFMDNEDGLKHDGITNEQLQKNIPPHLRYACIHWVNHFEAADMEDIGLMTGLSMFMDNCLLYWLEVLSLIGKLDSARCAIDIVLKLSKSRSFDLDLHQLLWDASCFISKFDKIIKRSALHIYHSALPFTPSDSLLYHRYKDAARNICGIEGRPEKWDVLVAGLNHGEWIDVLKFSLDSTLMVSFSEYNPEHYKFKQGMLKISNAITGTPISTISGHRFAVANDFSLIASSEDKTITFYNLNGSAQDTMFTTSSNIRKLALSSESSRLAAALSDGTVLLWDSRNAELIDCFDGFDSFEETLRPPRLQFSPAGTRLTYPSVNGIDKLWDGISGAFIADLQCGSERQFEFSGNGSRIGSLSHDCGLRLWNGENGALIGAITGIGGRDLVISENGSLLATAHDTNVQLWSGNDFLAQIEVLKTRSESMAFLQDSVLAIATSVIRLYNVKTRSFISTLLFEWPGNILISMAFSLDCTRLAAGDRYGSVYLSDVHGIDVSSSTSKEATVVTALALSPDPSRLACGFLDGTIELSETSPTKRRIAFQQAHNYRVQALMFGLDGGALASWSVRYKPIKLWNGNDVSFRRSFEPFQDPDDPDSMFSQTAAALSNTMLVTLSNMSRPQLDLDTNSYSNLVIGTLWSLDTLDIIFTFGLTENTSTVSIAENSTLIAIAYGHGVLLFDAVNYKRIKIIPFDVSYDIRTMIFLPDKPQLIARSDDGTFLSINLTNKHVMKGATLEHLIQFPNVSFWRGVPIWYCRDGTQHYFSALFPQCKRPIVILWIPEHLNVLAWTQGPSMMALSCTESTLDRCVILLQLPTSHIG